MSDKRLELIRQVKELKSFDLENDLNYSLTINYKNIVESFKYQKLDLEEIRNHITNFGGNITSWNLTITNLKRYDEEMYTRYYCTYDLILTCEEVLVNFSSRFLQLPYCEVKDDSIENALKLINFYKDKSKEIWNKATELSALRNL